MIERANLLIDQTSLSDKLDFQASIRRYSDKYSKKNKKDDECDKWKPDWTRLPRELKTFQSDTKPKKMTISTKTVKRKAGGGGSGGDGDKKKQKSVKFKKETMDFIDLDTLAKVIS